MTRSLVSKLVCLLPLTLMPAACSSDASVDIGSSTAQLSDYAASWDGYAEAATFPPSGSDRVRIVLAADGTGTLRLGDAALVAPPTQAAGGYLIDDSTGQGGKDGTDQAFRDGFEYPVHLAQVDAGRIQFGIDPLELYAAWCPLVPPVVNDQVPSGYACGATGGSFSSTTPPTCEYQFQTSDPTQNEHDPVDCGIYRLCVGGGPCTCTATACGPHVITSTGTSLDGYRVIVDAAIDASGMSLTGTLAITDSASTVNRITIRLQRSP